LTESCLRLSRFFLVTLTTLILVNLAVFSFFEFTPTVSWVIAPEDVRPEIGRAFQAPLNRRLNKLYRLPADSSETPVSSGLEMFEDGYALGPPHAQHRNIRVDGGGRFSHWNDHVIFSTPDGTDPTTNGRTYTITSPTTVQLQLQLLLTGVLALANAAFLMLFWEGVILRLRKRGALLIAVLGVSLILVTGLAAFGFFGTSIVARAGPPKDAALVTQTVLHAVLGCLSSIGIWAAGAGISRLTARDSDSDLARVLIPAFPIGMAVLAALLIIALTAP
jgi:hypothetical protein